MENFEKLKGHIVRFFSQDIRKNTYFCLFVETGSPGIVSFSDILYLISHMRLDGV